MYDRPMRTLQDTAIDIPRHVAQLADQAAADPAVRSVVLYGSRSVGGARPSSDWDIAVVMEGPTKPSAAVMAAGWEVAPEHGITVLSEADLLAKKDVYASLASEVSLGVVMRGINYETRDDPMAKRLFGTNTDEARSSTVAMMNQVWKLLREDIENVFMCRQSDFAAPQPGLGGAAADAAERVVKLVTLAHGLPFQSSHDVHELPKTCLSNGGSA